MNRHWQLETNTDGLGWLHFNHAESQVNILSRQALDEFEGLLDQLERLHLNGLIILSDKQSGFIAGADVKDFRGRNDGQEVESHIRHVSRHVC